MELSHNRTVKVIAWFLFLAAIIQPIYTALFMLAPEANRQVLWSIEALLFVLLSALGGSALVREKHYILGFSAIAFSAVFNVIQVGIGLNQFGPFREAARVNADLGGLASSVASFSFFGYNAAKVLLAMAAVIFGMALLKTSANAIKKSLGGLTVAIGVIAFITNALVMMLGIQGVVPRPLAGGTGVVATLLLALCLFSLKFED